MSLWPSSTTSYNDTGLSPSTTYTYTVAAYDAAGNNSAQSSQVSATTSSGGGGSGSVILKSATPQTSNMTFDYSGAIYDTYYTDPPHWKIINYNGYMTFGFTGQGTFTYHALGSTSGGVSYCYVNIYVNETLNESNKFIPSGWADYSISSSNFSSGSNTVKIELIGDTHFWIDEASFGTAGGNIYTISDGTMEGIGSYVGLIYANITCNPNSGPAYTPVTVTITFTSGGSYIDDIKVYQKVPGGSYNYTPDVDPIQQSVNVWVTPSNMILTGIAAWVKFIGVSSGGTEICLGIIEVNNPY